MTFSPAFGNGTVSSDSTSDQISDFTDQTVVATPTVVTQVATVESAVSLTVGPKVELYVNFSSFDADAAVIVDLPPGLFVEILNISTLRRQQEIENIIPVDVTDTNTLVINRDNNISGNSPFTMKVEGRAA